MSMVKLKNSSGQWEQIYNIKGDKGDTGDKGPTGSPGSLVSGTGVSVGTDAKISLSSVISAGSVGPTGNSTPAFSGTFNVPYFEYDAYGRVTKSANRTITMPPSPEVTWPNFGATTITRKATTSEPSWKSYTFKVSRDAYGRVSDVALSIDADCNCQAD